MQNQNGPYWYGAVVRFSTFFFILAALPLAQSIDRFPSLDAPAPLLNDVSHSAPEPPCGKEPVPSYPGLNDPPVVNSWSKSDFGVSWKPPSCTGWTDPGFSTLVTIVARFSDASDAEGMLRRIGTVSALAGMRYWSATHKRWRTLVEDAHALTDSNPAHRRVGFTPNEMKEGAVVYFEQADNLSGRAIYRMQIREASASRLVFDIENVGTIRYYLIPVLHPGDLQSIYFLTRESDGVWQYYSIRRTGQKANGLVARNESSSVNRAVAFYRHMVGIPTDQEPPAAR